MNNRQRKKLAAEKHNAALDESLKPKPEPEIKTQEERISERISRRKARARLMTLLAVSTAFNR